MRIIEFFKRLFHREKPIEIKQKKYLNPPKKMKQKKKELLVKRVLQHLKKFIKKIFKKQKSY